MEIVIQIIKDELLELYRNMPHQTTKIRDQNTKIKTLEELLKKLEDYNAKSND